MFVQYLKLLRRDLESVRELALQTRRRESRKLAQTESVQKVLEIALFPHEALLRLAFEKVLAYAVLQVFTLKRSNISSALIATVSSSIRSRGRRSPIIMMS
jgi:hypothetical protein